MDSALAALGIGTSLGWCLVAADYLVAMRTVKFIEDFAPFRPEEAAEAPSVSIIVAACNEEEKLEAAFRTLLATEYPGELEIIAINDRSTDSTGAILDRLAALAPSLGKRVIVLHNDRLPPGWLGKNHALYQGARRAHGRYLFFTDADVHLEPDTLSRSLRYAAQENLHQLSTFFTPVLQGFGEHVFGLTFSFFFFQNFRPWHVRNPKRRYYLGVGAFNLVRRDAYDAIGQHRAIALQVADDMELGKALKRAGFTCDFLRPGGRVKVRWQESFRALIGGLIKNTYAGLGYSKGAVFVYSLLLFLASVFPVLGLFLATPLWVKGCFAFAVAILIALGMSQAKESSIPPVYAFTLPFASTLLLYLMYRSAYVTEKNGGISWRGTHYSLTELRAAAVPEEPSP